VEATCNQWQMTFKLFTSTGQIYGPYGSLPLAQKEALGKLLGDKRVKGIEIRPSCSLHDGGYNRYHKGSFYKFR
jgi:hypothetical protein